MAVVHFVRMVPAADGVLVPARGGLRFTPTAAQTTAQVKALTRQNNALIRLAGQQFDADS